MIEADIYRALGDPIRLKIVMRLAGGSPSTIGKLSKNLGISRQGARKHFQVLVSANVIHLIPEGRETRVVLDARTLQIARTFISKLESQWDERLDALKTLVENKSRK